MLVFSSLWFLWTYCLFIICGYCGFSSMLTHYYIYLLQSGSHMSSNTFFKNKIYIFSHPSSTFYDFFFYCPLLYLFAIHYSYHHFHNICILILCTALLKWFTFQLWFSLSYRFLLLFYLDNTFQYFFLGRFSTAVREGDGTPLQYSCLENPWMEEPGRLQSMGSLRVGHDWATSLSLFTSMHWRRQWQSTPVFLPGESQGWDSLVGYRLWGRTESDTTEATWQQQQQQYCCILLGFDWEFLSLS